MINAMSGLHTSPQTSSILTAVDATIVLTYVMNVLLIASQKGSACWPNTQYAWDKCRNGTVKVYESVQDAVGVHQTSGGRTKVRARSSASCAMLHREPDNAKKMNRGGCLPHTTHVSASDEEPGIRLRAAQNDASKSVKSRRERVLNLNHGQDTRANRTRHTTSSSTQSHAKQQHTKKELGVRTIRPYLNQNSYFYMLVGFSDISETTSPIQALRE